MNEIQLSEHAMRRMAQRGLSQEDIQYVCEYGHPINCAGAEHRILRKIDIPTEDCKGKMRLTGTVVVLNPVANIVLTAYRNAHAARHVRLKPRWGVNQSN